MSDGRSAVDGYLAAFPPDVKAQLKAVRQTIGRAAPGAEEVISYGNPTLMLGGRSLVYFAGWKHHISLYPIPDDAVLDLELAPYRSGKGTLRFPLAEPIPLGLVQRVVTSLVHRRVEETP